MGLETIRVDVTTAVEAARSTFVGGYTLKVEYGNNRIIDTKIQTDPYLSVDIKILDAEQANLALNPTHRFWGNIVVSAVVPCGSGTKKANLLLEHFYKALHRKTHGTVRTFIAEFAPTQESAGWEHHMALIPFWSDQPS